jgi:hypothetical protein
MVTLFLAIEREGGHSHPLFPIILDGKRSARKCPAN